MIMLTEHMNTVSKHFLLLVAIAAFVGCASKPLPEADSPVAKTYVRACGSCHVVYRPEMFTAGMWRTVVDRMDREMTRRQRPMPAATKQEILAYLQRNAGTR